MTASAWIIDGIVARRAMCDPLHEGATREVSRAVVACCKRYLGRIAMTLCPIALAVGCRKCPAFSVCPLKALIGDFRPEQKTSGSAPKSGSAKRARKQAS